MLSGTNVLRLKQIYLNIQYESARAVTVAMKGTSARWLISELAWESLRTRRKMHKLFCIFKITKYVLPAYLVELLPLL